MEGIKNFLDVMWVFLRKMWEMALNHCEIDKIVGKIPRKLNIFLFRNLKN